MILWIPTRLPGLNELLGAKSTQRGAWSAYNQLKQKWHGQIKLLVQAKRIQPADAGFFSFLFVEPDKRRDPDNIVAGGVKLLFDSLVGAEVLTGDGWGSVLGFVGYWTVGDKPGCLVLWNATKLTGKAEMLATLEKELRDAKQKDGRGAGIVGNGVVQQDAERVAGGKP